MNAADGRANEFPWDSVMAAAFGLLRLSPGDFWSMTPREMERAMSVLGGERVGAPGRHELAELMHRFPDHFTPTPNRSPQGGGGRA
ncbi:rcc01693 family protein [Mesorhizobium sp. KR9-304]|uniref:rcc01693 family protein n=1 Tax=Mesorhizobium sp. KR9-304 TaxID=3156614 RepID=UPI0032B345A3